MSRVVRVQTNFSTGELDPLLRSRIDLNQYYNALETASNVFILPQGGVKRRDGLRFTHQLPSAAGPENGVRLIPFEFNVSDTYMFAITAGRIYIYRNKALVTNINATGDDFLAVSSITAAMLPNLRYAQSADTIIFVHEDLPPLRIVRGANHQTWTQAAVTFTNIPRHAFSLATQEPSTTLTPDGVSGNIKLTTGGGVWNASDHIGQYVNNKDTFGRARIVKVESTTVAFAVTETGFFDTSAIASGDWELETGYVDAWSSAKGWPTSVTFHEGRLFFGGSKGQPTTFWGSTVNQFFDFDLGEALADQAIQATITTDSLNAIVDIFSGRDLQIFTTAGEFYLPQGQQEPITPQNLTVKVATRHGIKKGVPVAGLDSGTIFVQRLGKSLNELFFTDAELSYTSSTISLLSSHMLLTPIDMAIRRASSTEEADRLYIVNSDDGSMAVYALLRSQSVVAPSRITTDGDFLAVGVDVDTVYSVVKRVLPAKATCTITVSNASAVVAGDTITFQDQDGTEYTLTATDDDPPTGETATALKFSTGDGSNNGVADNIAVGHGGSLGINSLAGFAAPNPAANVITVTRQIPGNSNLTVTSSRPSAISVTNFTGGTASAVYYVECFDSDYKTDSGFISASASATGAAAHLENATLNCIVDGNIQSNKIVSSGVVTFDASSASSYEVGLPFVIDIKTLPVEPRMPSGNLKGFKKRILEVNAEVYNSQAMSVNGQLVPFRNFGSGVLDTSVTPFTGVKTIGPLLGFTKEGTITVSQTVPLPLTLLALDYKLSLGA